jgi:flagellar protein FlaF
MQKAVSAGPDAAETQAALAFLQQLWVILIDDLSRPDNALPDALKAKLISIGIFVMKEIEEVRRTRSNDLQPLIDISSLIEQGLN